MRGARLPDRLGLEGVPGAAERVCGIPLPGGLLDGSRLPEPLYTPSTKGEAGTHDENISYAATEAAIGAADAAELRRLTLAIYQKAAQHAESRGLILADTKFEFGRTAEGIILADEVLTPDSSRFWEAAAWKPGGAQPSFDKQFVRDYLEAIHWNKQAPAPGLPDDVVERTQAKYLEAFRRLTGRESESLSARELLAQRSGARHGSGGLGDRVGHGAGRAGRAGAGLLPLFLRAGRLGAGLGRGGLELRPIGSAGLPLVRIKPVANAIGFLAIALLVMALAGFAGGFCPEPSTTWDWVAWTGWRERSSASFRALCW